MSIHNPSLLLNSLRWRYAPLGYGWPLQFSRSGVALYPDAAGVLRQAASGALRHAFDPPSGEYLGGVIEEQRSNLLLRSHEFDNASWTKSAASISANAGTAPDGTTTADKLVEDSSNGVHLAYQDVTISSGVTHTLSVVASDAGRSQIFLSAQNTSGTNGFSAYFNLSTGAVTGLAAAGTGTAISATTINLGGGRWRCCITGIVGSSATTARCHTYLASSGSPGYQGNGTSGVYLWGAQLEAGAVVTSIIATAGSQATRNADLITIPTSAFAYNASEGTLLVRYRSAAALGANECALQLSDAGGTNYIALFNNSGVGGLRCLVSGGAADFSLGTAQPLTDYALALSYKANNFSGCFNGGAVTTDPSGSVPAGMDTLRIGSQIGFGNWLNSTVQQVLYFPRWLAPAELQALTL